jgi:hypothetical protein
MEKVKGVTYHDILVAPVAKAMNYVAKNAKGPIHMYLTLQGGRPPTGLLLRRCALDRGSAWCPGAAGGLRPRPQIVGPAAAQRRADTPVAHRPACLPACLPCVPAGETGKSIIFGPRYWALSYKLAKAAMTEGLEASRAAIMKVRCLRLASAADMPGQPCQAGSAAPAPGSPPARPAQIGVSMNHNQICACINFSNIKKDNFVNTYCKEFNSQLSKNNLVFDYAGIQVRCAALRAPPPAPTPLSERAGPAAATWETCSTPARRACCCGAAHQLTARCACLCRACTRWPTSSACPPTPPCSWASPPWTSRAPRR